MGQMAVERTGQGNVGIARGLHNESEDEQSKLGGDNESRGSTMRARDLNNKSRD